ncbi:MAG: ABC transporter ATP-binding protein [Spirochaetota bacterium]
MIRIRELTKQYAGITAVDRLSLDIQAGEIFGFLGPNGAGKTTTIRILSTITLPTSGTVSISGYDVVRQPVRAKQQIGVVHQTMNIDPDLTGIQNLLIHGMFFKMSRQRIARRSQEVLDLVDLGGRARSRAGLYSGGMKRRLTIARALLHEPALLIMDEPTVGLDAHTRRRIWDIVRRLNRSGVTVLLTTHYIEEAQALSERVGIIHKGRLIALGSPSELMSSRGSIAVEVEDPAGVRVEFFTSRGRAGRYVSSLEFPARVRDTSLEDVFISMTGSRVDPGTEASGEPGCGVPGGSQSWFRAESGNRPNPGAHREGAGA